MQLPITLTDLEVAALQSEASGGESLEQVLHRLIGPLVARTAKTRLDSLMVRFQSSSPDRQAEVVSILEKQFPS